MLISYELVAYWSEWDQSFVVEVPKLPRMYGGRGDEQAVADAQDVIEQWIETARELGRSVPEPRGRHKAIFFIAIAIYYQWIR